MTNFATFYAAYPRKVGKRTAEKAWKQTEKARPPLKELLDALTLIWNLEWCQREHKFIPHPATWLRGHGWEDTEYVMALASKETLSVLLNQVPKEGDGSFIRRIAIRHATELGAPTEALQSCHPDDVPKAFREATGKDFFEECLPHMV